MAFRHRLTRSRLLRSALAARPGVLPARVVVERVHNFRDRVSRAPAEGIHGPVEGTHRVVGQDHVFRDGQPSEAHRRGKHEPSEPIAGEVPGTGEKSDERADHGESAGAGTPGPQRVRQEHLQDQERRSGPHRGPAEFDGDDDRHGRDHCRPAERANAVAAVGIGDQQCSEEACSGAEQRYPPRFSDTEHDGHRNQRGPRKYCRARGSSTTTSPSKARVNHFEPRSDAGHHGISGILISDPRNRATAERGPRQRIRRCPPRQRRRSANDMHYPGSPSLVSPHTGSSKSF